MRRLGLFAIVGTLAVAAGCGGGGATAGPTAQVAGKLNLLDTTALGTAALSPAGYEVTCLNDGVSVETLADGTFRITVPSGVVIRLQLSEPGGDDQSRADDSPDAKDGDDASDDASDDLDETSDKGDIDGDVVEIEPLGEGEVCEIEIAFADGEVLGCEFDFPDEDGKGEDGEGEDGPGAFHGETRLFATDPTGEEVAAGELEVEIEHGCVRVELEAHHLPPGSGIEVLLVSPDLVSETIVRGEVNVEGVLHLVLERCEGDPLPFGVATFADLAGYGVIVQTLEGEALLVGTLPAGAPDLPDGFEIPEGFEDEFEELEDLLEDLLGADSPLGELLPK